MSDELKPVTHLCWGCGVVKPSGPPVPGPGLASQRSPPASWMPVSWFSTHLESGTTIRLGLNFCPACQDLGSLIGRPLPPEKQVEHLFGALERLGGELAARFIPLLEPLRPESPPDLAAELEAAKAARELLVKASNAALDEVRRDYQAKLERERARADAAERRAVEALRKGRTLPLDPRIDKLCLVQPNDRRDKGPFEAGVYLERRRQRDDTSLFAVTWMGRCLAKDGTWEYEPTPSERDDAFTERCRFTTLEAAEKLAMASLHTRWQEVAT